MPEGLEGQQPSFVARAVDKISRDARDIVGLVRRKEPAAPQTLEQQLKEANMPTANISEVRPSTNEQVKQHKIQKLQGSLDNLHDATEALSDNSELDAAIIEGLISEGRF